MGTPKSRSNNSIESGIETIDINAAAVRSPIVYLAPPPAWKRFPGNIGGTGDTANATRAIFTAGWRSKTATRSAATASMTTFIDSSARRSLPGERNNEVASAGVSLSANPSTVRKMLVFSASGMMVARLIGHFPNDCEDEPPPESLTGKSFADLVRLAKVNEIP
jgi:hypothetical protein